MDKSKIKSLCKYLDNNVAERYPIENEELATGTDFIKNGYLKMLAVVLQQAENIYDSQWNIFKRIVSGAGTDKKAEDYLRMALDIEIEDYINFCNECKDLNLKYRWILDALIITCVHNKEPKQIELIAQFCESLIITKEELNYIATMAGAIVKMSESDYVCAHEIKEDTVPDYVFNDYMYLICNSCVLRNDYMTILQPVHKEDVSVQILRKFDDINTPCIKITGVVFNMPDGGLWLKNRKKVILENCKFIGWDENTFDTSNNAFDKDENALHFYNCDEIIISNCCFENFRVRTLVFELDDNCAEVMVKNCQFKNCKRYYHQMSMYIFQDRWSKGSGVIFSDNPEYIARFELINSSFIDCGGVNFGNTYCSAFISNIRTLVDNCSFENCWHRSDGEIDPDCDSRTMFTAQSSATNCKYINSARFN